MRILVVTHQLARVGGIETYLDALLTALAARGHSLALACELGAGGFPETIGVPPGVPVWCESELGPGAVIAQARPWSPDLVFLQGQSHIDFESAFCALAPVVFFAHGHFGACITSEKSFKFPAVSACQRRFGWQCLTLYYPRRCGGLSPLTMLREYSSQSRRLKLMRQCSAIVVASDYMRREYVLNDVPPQLIHRVPLPAGNEYSPGQLIARSKEPDRELRVLFAGRMSPVKGGTLLLDAIPMVAASLQRPLRVTFAGDGSERRRWEARANAIKSSQPAVTIDFPGWLAPDELNRLIADVDLLVFPSVWPEPFGLVGPEAGKYGVPAVAFDVGGVSEWLIDNVNGVLASAKPPSAAALADAMCKCVHDPVTYLRLCEGARRVAARFSMEQHLDHLMPILTAAAGARVSVPGRLQA